MKQTVEDDKVKDKISEDEIKQINDKCEESIKWLDANQTAEKDEFEYQKKELEKVCTPIITKMYQASGGGGMPGKLDFRFWSLTFFGHFRLKFRCLNKTFIFHQNFDFWPKFSFENYI